MSESSKKREPAPFTATEFDAWRGLIRMRESVMREIDRRLAEAGEMSLDDYGVLITLVGQPERRLRMSALADRRLLTASGITRAVMRLERRGFVLREPDPEDGRASFAVLTDTGLAALRRAQRVHHAAVRELYLGRLTEREQRQIARLFEKALPGVVSSADWPMPRPG